MLASQELKAQPWQRTDAEAVIAPLSTPVAQREEHRCPICARTGNLGEACPDHDRFFVGAEDLEEAPRLHLLGELIAEKYVVLGLLGRGAVGTVYWGVQYPIGRKVAIKVLHTDMTVSASERERFLREARSLARVSDNHVVACYDYGFTKHQVAYMVLEFVEGLSLEELLSARSRLNVPQVVFITRRLLEGISRFHDVGVVHRDLKPANIMVSLSEQSEEVLKLIDFGLVRYVQDSEGVALTHHGTILGTPLYMSPEQALGHDDVSQSSDVYALGAMIYQMLTGHPPFEGESVMDVMLSHVQRRVAPIQGRHVPTRLKSFVYRCLAKSPEDRFASGGAALEALNALELPEEGLTKVLDALSEKSPRQFTSAETVPLSLRIDEALIQRLRGEQVVEDEPPQGVPQQDLFRRWWSLLGETVGATWSLFTAALMRLPPVRWACRVSERCLKTCGGHLASSRLGRRLPRAAALVMTLLRRVPLLAFMSGLWLMLASSVVSGLVWARRAGQRLIRGVVDWFMALRTIRSLNERTSPWGWSSRLLERRPWLSLPFGLLFVCAEALSRARRLLSMEADGWWFSCRNAHEEMACRLLDRLEGSGSSNLKRRRRWVRLRRLARPHLWWALFVSRVACLVVALAGVSVAGYQLLERWV